ncbi:hypothetical protein [Tissierella sp.]
MIKEREYKERQYIENGIKFRVRSNKPSDEAMNNFVKKLVEIAKGIE